MANLHHLLSCSNFRRAAQAAVGGVTCLSSAADKARTHSRLSWPPRMFSPSLKSQRTSQSLPPSRLLLPWRSRHQRRLLRQSRTSILSLGFGRFPRPRNRRLLLPKTPYQFPLLSSRSRQACLRSRQRRLKFLLLDRRRQGQVSCLSLRRHTRLGWEATFLAERASPMLLFLCPSRQPPLQHLWRLLQRPHPLLLLFLRPPLLLPFRSLLPSPRRPA